MTISTANGGVVVSMVTRHPNEPHAVGLVLSRGGGVPWVDVGSYVLYQASEATELKVDVTAYADIPELGGRAQGGSDQMQTVFLIDQRSIHARINDRARN